MMKVRRLFQNASHLHLGFPRFARATMPIPEELRENFRLLYADIGWFGVLNGSTLAFLTIYAARLGANADQIGLINAAPAVVILLLSLPAGFWLQKRAVNRSVFWSAFLTRIFYLLLVPLPLLFNASQQIWMVILFTFLMNIPYAVLNLGFNTLFAEAVPMEWRGHVAGVRNAVFAVTSIISTLASGFILKTLAFPFGYQVVFLLGFIGAALSTLNLYRLRPVPRLDSGQPLPLTDAAPTEFEPSAKLARRANMFGALRENLQVDILRGSYGKILLLLGFFHLAWYLPMPLFPIYQVGVMRLSDQTLSLGQAFYHVAIFIGSTQLARISHRIGNHRSTAIGLMMLAFYPMLLGLSTRAEVFLVAMFISGMAWSLGGGALYNYLLEKVPPESRPTYLAWFSLGMNAAILAGSLLGPVVAGFTSITFALLLFALFRLLTGFAILRWG